MKVYVITISDVYDYEGFRHTPIVCKTKEQAMKELRALRAEAKFMLLDNGNDDWEMGDDVFNDKSESFSMYPEGYWGTSHYDAVIDEVEVEEE
jgi:hypothetical protein